MNKNYILMAVNKAGKMYISMKFRTENSAAVSVRNVAASLSQRTTAK